MVKVQSITLADLHRMSALVSIKSLAIAAGINVSTLHARLRRGSPELTAVEVDAIRTVLHSAGLDVYSTQPLAAKATRLKKSSAAA
jgi:hypothetical protein